MKAISAKIYGGLTIGSLIKIDDNSGARLLKILSKIGYKGRRGRLPDVGIGDLCVGSVVKGKIEMRKKILRAVIIRQKKEYRRRTGERIGFEDNAAIILNEKNEPQASEIKGVIAKEVAERFPKVATIAKNVI